MQDQKKRPETLADADLDQANGGLKITMNDLIITSYQTGGSGAGDPVPARGGNSVAIERLELAVEKIERG